MEPTFRELPRPEILRWVASLIVEPESDEARQMLCHQWRDQKTHAASLLPPSLIESASITCRPAQSPNIVDVRSGSLADMATGQRDVRFTPNSGHSLQQSECPLWATSGPMHCSKSCPYSITSSARPRNGSGTVMPSALSNSHELVA